MATAQELQEFNYLRGVTSVEGFTSAGGTITLANGLKRGVLTQSKNYFREGSELPVRITLKVSSQRRLTSTISRREHTMTSGRADRNGCTVCLHNTFLFESESLTSGSHQSSLESEDHIRKAQQPASYSAKILRCEYPTLCQYTFQADEMLFQVLYLTGTSEFGYKAPQSTTALTRTSLTGL